MKVTQAKRRSEREDWTDSERKLVKEKKNMQGMKFGIEQEVEKIPGGSHLPPERSSHGHSQDRPRVKTKGGRLQTPHHQQMQQVSCPCQILTEVKSWWDPTRKKREIHKSLKQKLSVLQK